MKLKGSELIRYWANRLTLSFDNTHDLDLQVSRSEFDDMERKGCESCIHDHDVDFCVTMVGVGEYIKLQTSACHPHI